MSTELLTDSGHTRADLKMIESSIRKGWKIPDQLLEALPKVAGAMALKGRPRDQIAAMKVLLAMKEQNEKAEPQNGQGPTINVGVQIDNRNESSKALQFIERFRKDRISGEPESSGIEGV